MAKIVFNGDLSDLQFLRSTPVRVPYGHTDAMGYLYYGNYPLYFEVGRNEAMRALGIPYAKIEEDGVIMPVVHMEIHYDTPAHYDDLLIIHTGILEQGPASVTFGYRVDREVDGARIVWGYTRLAFASTETRRPVRVPAWVIERLEGAATGA